VLGIGFKILPGDDFQTSFDNTMLFCWVRGDLGFHKLLTQTNEEQFVKIRQVKAQ